MNKVIFVLMLLVNCCMIHAGNAQQIEVVSGQITQDITLTADKTWLLRGYVYVKNGATMRIEPGTIIKGERASKGALIITRTGRIEAQGTPSQPIIFTSYLPEGSRNSGDWGGVIILGQAPINTSGGESEIEGGVNNGDGDAFYGGNDPDHSSGVFSYVHIHFPGIPFQPDNEINGLTMGGVGRGTRIDHVQVSFSGDDAFEWFGGTVNCKYLVALNTLDDDFDTDQGYTGHVQYALAIRNPRLADISESNGFESDNSSKGGAFEPYTRGIFSNVTIIGPIGGPAPTFNGLYQAGVHMRRNSKLCIYNSVLTGFPVGYFLDGEFSEGHALNDELRFSNNVIAGCEEVHDLVTYETNPMINLDQWLAENNNQIEQDLNTLNLTDPFSTSRPDARPAADSPLLRGASFDHPDLQDTTFSPVNFRGAFGAEADWTAGWVNWDPQNTTTVDREEAQSDAGLIAKVWPNPARTVVHMQIDSERFSGRLARVEILDMQGRTVRRKQTALSPRTRLSLTVQELPRGLYFLRLSTGNTIHTQKLMIQR